MIEELQREQRGSLDAFKEGLTEWVRGDDSESAEAAALNVANILHMLGDMLSDGKFTGSG
jgi:hypothetical protein